MTASDSGELWAVTPPRPFCLLGVSGFVTAMTPFSYMKGKKLKGRCRGRGSQAVTVSHFPNLPLVGLLSLLSIPDQYARIRRNRTTLTPLTLTAQYARARVYKERMQMAQKTGQNHGRAKLTDHEVELLRKMVESGELTRPQAQEKFELSKSYVSRLCRYIRR